ncbi:MAG: radical SAM protein [Syntrophobacter sp.]
MEQSSFSGILNVTQNLIALERGGDELLLVNSFYMLPLYVARGRERVGRLLDGARGLTLEGLKSAFPQDAALIALLRDHRILVDSSTEKERYEFPEIQAVTTCRPRERITVYLLLTEACNLGCIYCLNGAETYIKSTHSKMSRDVALRSITACLDELSPGGHLEVAFFGGEPLLNWPLAKEIISGCENGLKQKYEGIKITYHITSNLTICPPDLLELIKRHSITVMSDVDGPDDIHNRCRPYLHGGPSHARTAETIRRLVDAGIPVALRATITSANHDRIPDIAAEHKALGASNCALVPVSPLNSDRNYLPRDLFPDPEKLIAGLVEVYRSGLWDKQKLFPFNQYLLKLRPGARQITACAAPSGTTPVVRVNGDIYPCIYVVGQEKYRFGTLGSKWDRRPLDRALVSLHVDNVAKCSRCAWRYACGGGCPIMSLAPMKESEKSAWAVEYGHRINCDLTKAILEELLWDVADQVMAGIADGHGTLPEEAPDRTNFC